MIYNFLKGRLESVDALGGNVFPTGACIDDVEGAFAVYTFKEQTSVKDLSGEVHHYRDVILVDFLGKVYDDLHEIYCQVQEALDVNNYDTGNGEYIFSVDCISPEPDSHDLETGLLRRSMQVTILWCPI